MIDRCPNCKTPLAPTAVACPSCGRALEDDAGPTVLESPAGLAETIPPIPEVKPFDPEELPPWIVRLDIILLVFLGLAGLVWNFWGFRPDRREILARSVQTCGERLAQGSGLGWRRSIRPWPPQTESVDVIRILPEKGPAEEQATALLSQVRIVPREELRLDDREAETARKDARESLLILKAADGPLSVFFDVSFYAADMPSVPTFAWREGKGLIGLWWRPLLHLMVLLVLVAGLRTGLIARFRDRRRREVEAYDRAVTARRFQEKSDLDEARRSVERGQIAQALVKLNRALASNPGYVEATQLKRLLQTDPALTQGGAALLGRADRAAADNEPVLYLRILGTPYAYETPAGTEVVRLGRQRRKPGELADTGNDLVIRVPGCDQESLRISRRHLEIQRIDKDYFAQDRSQGRTRLNGQILDPEKPVPLHTGDRLILGGAITLEVLFRTRIARGTRQSALQVQPPQGEGIPRVSLEATIGDMVTEVLDA